MTQVSFNVPDDQRIHVTVFTKSLREAMAVIQEIKPGCAMEFRTANDYKWLQTLAIGQINITAHYGDRS